MEIPQATLSALRGRETLCGFSGGADSAALLLLLSERAPAGGFSVSAVHFEHGLRGAESEGDAAFCEELCARFGIPFRKIPLSVPESLKPGEGIEAAARRLRLENWLKLASSKTAIALGHNADDRAENLLLRLFRGSNATGLSSMRQLQTLGGALFVRPLLGTPRSEIEAFLKARGVPWRNDSSNADEAFKRNFLRKSVLPAIAEAMPYARGGIARSLKALEDDASYLEESAQLEYLKMGEDASAERWLALRPALRVRALRLWLSGKLGGDFVPDASLVERFDAELAKAGGEEALIPLRERDAFIAVSSDGLDLRAAKAVAPADVDWNWRERPSIEWGGFSLEAVETEAPGRPSDSWSALFELAAAPDSFLLGRWREGERMTPLGRKSPEKLKELFGKAGVGSSAREELPVVRLPSGEPVWLPGVKRGSFAPLPEGAAKALLLKAKRA